MEAITEYLIQGFGSGKQPLNIGVTMATTYDPHYARDIALACAKNWPEQYFGVTNVKTGTREIWKVKIELSA